MPAYFLLVEKWCADPACSKRAVGELRNSQNAKIADYCKKHGEQRAKEMNDGR